MTTSRDRGEATRRRILLATAELISRAGWSGFSTRDIASLAGVTQGVVTYHWRSKDDLVREAALTAATESLAPVSAALTQAPTVRLALERSLELIEAVREQRELTLLLVETMLQAGRDARLRDALADMLHDFRTQLASALERDGVPDPDPRAAVLAAALDGLLLHAVVDDRLEIARAGACLLPLADPR